MGKANILEAHGEGQYTIQIIEARERAESAKRQAQARIAERRVVIGALDNEILGANAAVGNAVAAQDAAVARFQSEGGDVAELSKYAAAVMEAAGARNTLVSRRRALETMIVSDEALVARVGALPPLRQMRAWCADYTEDLSGVVATAEVPGEIGQILIRPGFDGSNSWSSGADGAMQPALAGTPAGTFYNLAMMPGWQKWRPGFRVAIIAAIDGDQCDIDLDSASSSQQGLGVNAKDSYSGVPILYMDCDGAAFEEGDRVLVAFAGNVKGPTVVGFESSPKVCCEAEILAIGPTTGQVWPVKSLYEGMSVKGGKAARWRIIEIESERLVVGGFTDPDESGGRVLAGMPEEVDTVDKRVWEHVIISSTSVTVKESDRSGDPWTTITPPTSTEYAGGVFGIHVSTTPPQSLSYIEEPNLSSTPYPYNENATGFINASGVPVFTTPAWYPSPDGALFHDDWGVGDTYYATLIYWRRPRLELRLEKGCASGDDIKWPEVDA